MKTACASGTARLIALATIMRPGSAPPKASHFCELLLRESPRLLALGRSSLARRLGVVLERVLLPGVVAHWLSRKREIDRLVREASRQGFSQLLVLGAGLDTLPYRADEENLFTRVIAVDHPATLASLPSVDSRVERCPIDLATDSPLPSVSWLPTVVVVEGLLMYLQPEAVQQLLRKLESLAVPRIRLVASWMLETEMGRIGFRQQSWLVRAWLHWRGEPMLWASTPPQFRTLLQDLGWHEVQILRFGLEDEQLVVADSSLEHGAGWE